MSKFHFHRLFKSAVGVSPSRYYINLRMNVARQLLRETKKSVVDVALDVDYANPSHFAKLFRRETGHSPVPRMFPRLSATHFYPWPRGFEQYRDRLSKNTCDGDAIVNNPSSFNSDTEKNRRSRSSLSSATSTR